MKRLGRQNKLPLRTASNMRMRRTLHAKGCKMRAKDQSSHRHAEVKKDHAQDCWWAVARFSRIASWSLRDFPASLPGRCEILSHRFLALSKSSCQQKNRFAGAESDKSLLLQSPVFFSQKSQNLRCRLHRFCLLLRYIQQDTPTQHTHTHLSQHIARRLLYRIFHEHRADQATECKATIRQVFQNINATFHMDMEALGTAK